MACMVFVLMLAEGRGSLILNITAVNALPGITSCVLLYTSAYWLDGIDFCSPPLLTNIVQALHVFRQPLVVARLMWGHSLPSDSSVSE
jgi:hypothetical protein